MLDFEQLVSGVDKDAIVDLPLKKLFVIPGQPRKKFDENVERIRKSLQEVDPHTNKRRIIRNPIHVLPPNDDGLYRVVHGECRFRASTLEDRDSIRAIIRWDLADVSEADIYLEQLSDNGERGNLDAEEIGEAAVAGKEKYGHSLEVIAKANGNLPVSYVSECVTLYKVLHTPEYDFIGALYREKLSKDVRVFNVLIRLAEKNIGETKRLVEWARQNHCVTRSWANQLKDMDDSTPLETKISDLEKTAEAERIAKERRQQELAEKKAAKKAAKAAKSGSADLSTPEEVEDGAEDNDGSQTAENAIKGDATDVSVETAELQPQAEIKQDNEQSYSVRPVAKAKLHVLHNQKASIVLLDRKDNEQGFIWIHVYGEGDKRVPMDELVIFDLE